jgi:hypothetical protein
LTVEFFGIDPGGAAADSFEREGRNHLVARHQLAVASRRPAEQTQEIDHRIGQISKALVLRHRRDAVPLAQLLLVGAENQRHVRKLGWRLPERLPQQNVLRRVGDVIVAPNDVRNPHVDVVGHHGEVIDRQAVRAENDEILNLLVIDLDMAAHVIVV